MKQEILKAWNEYQKKHIGNEFETDDFDTAIQYAENLKDNGSLNFLITWDNELRQIMKQKTFTTVRIELGTIEAISFEEAKELVDSEGFQVNCSEEKVIEHDNLVDNKFYGNLDFEIIESLRDKRKPITKSKRFTFELEHDNGKINISVYAKNYQSAITQILNAEGCPESAILSIKQS